VIKVSLSMGKVLAALRWYAAERISRRRARARLRSLSERRQGQLGERSWTREDLYDR